MAKARRKHNAAAQRSIYPPLPEIVGLGPDEHSLEPLAWRRERRERYFRRFIDKADRAKMVDRTRFRVSEMADALSTLPGSIIPEAAKREAAVTMLCQEILRGEFNDQKGRPQIAYLHPSPLASIQLNTKDKNLEDIRKIIDQLWIKKQPCLDWFARKKQNIPEGWVPSGPDVPNTRSLPAQTSVIVDQAAPQTDLVHWLENEVSQLTAAGKLPDRITDCARWLEARLSTADKSLRRVKARHIENTLRTYGLFPKTRRK